MYCFHSEKRQKPWEKLKVNRAELYFVLVIAFFSYPYSCIILLREEKKETMEIDMPPAQCVRIGTIIVRCQKQIGGQYRLHKFSYNFFY